VEAAENTDEARFSPGERYAARYEINMLRCIFCGFCQEACPTGAIVLRNDFELSNYSREDSIFTKEMLLQPMPLIRD
jgi:NADH-quinone oxidoreductase subunit I